MAVTITPAERVAVLKRTIRVLNLTDVRQRVGRTKDDINFDLSVLELMITELGGDIKNVPWRQS